jgi:hypothetical protein
MQYIHINAGDAGKKVTFAAKVKVEAGQVRAYFSGNPGFTDLPAGWNLLVHTFSIPEGTESFYVGLQARTSPEILCEWMALYEGEYTAETLPEYQPKGYAAELQECRRYYLSFGDMQFRSTMSENPIHNVTITFPVTMIATPSVTAEVFEPPEGSAPPYVATPDGVAYSVYGEKFALENVVATVEFP